MSVGDNLLEFVVANQTPLVSASKWDLEVRCTETGKQWWATITFEGEDARPQEVASFEAVYWDGEKASTDTTLPVVFKVKLGGEHHSILPAKEFE